MEGSAGAMALVLGQTAAGSAAMLWSVPLWHEVRRGYFTLSRAVLAVLPVAWLVAVAVEAVAVVSAGFRGGGTPAGINPLLTAGALAPWIAVGMVGTTALIAVLVKIVLRGARASAVQSATGFFYLAVVTA